MTKVYLLLLVLLSIFAIAPLLQPGYFWAAHDARHSVYFLFEFDRSVSDGILYPRWSPDFAFSYGYPFFNIYGPLAFYVGEGFHLLGLDFVSSVKAVFALAFVLSGVSMFFFVRRLLGAKAGLLAGLVYIYIPYHLVDVYVRGALAESLALAVLPLVLWLFYELVASPSLANLIGAGLSYAAMMLVHNGLALLISPLLGLYLVYLVVFGVPWKAGPAGVRLFLELLRRAIPPLLGLLLGLGLSAIFWLPMAMEFKYVRLDQWLGGYYNYREHFVHVFQFFSPDWGFGVSQSGPKDGFSFQLGAVPVVLSIVSLAVLGRVSKEKGRLLSFFQVAILVITLLTLSESLPLWEVLRLVTFAQFPWRLLTLAMLPLSILAGSILGLSESEEVHPLAPLALAALVILGSYSYLQPEIVEPAEGPVSLQGLMRFQQSSGEMTGSTIWVHKIPTWSPMAESIVVQGQSIATKIDFASLPKGEKEIVANTFARGTTYDLIGFRAKAPGRILFNTFYYPGWHAYLLDDQEGPIVEELKIEPHGTMGQIAVHVPTGEHYLLLRFEDTPVRVVGKCISGGCLALVILVLVTRMASARLQRR